jgi:hypothetical protein
MVNRYDSDSDSPAWIAGHASLSNEVTRYVAGLDVQPRRPDRQNRQPDAAAD